MTTPKTLMELSGADLEPSKLDVSNLVLIDMQNEYLQGPIAVSGADAAIDHAKNLLAKAREAGSRIIHIAHRGREGGLFDRNAERGQIIQSLSPTAGEEVVEKTLPNAFTDTRLKALLDESGNTELILIGFMTHMCVSSSARAALDHGFRVTIDADSCATRDLPD
ncbi:MAG: cysteine hydrolase family protein, partial [Gammaproteobacteria bacterium]